MIYDLLPTALQILHLKMKACSSLEGFLDALRDIMDELELNAETQDSYQYFKECLDIQENLWAKQQQQSLSWITEKIEFLKRSKFTGYEKVFRFIQKSEESIKKGTTDIFAGRNYFEMRLKLLESSSKMVAEYGHFDILKEWTKNEKVGSEVIDFAKDPLLAQNSQSGTIFPGTEYGKHLENANSGKGFIKAYVIEPHEFCSRRRYEIQRGLVDFNYPLFLNDFKKTLEIPSPVLFDKWPSLHLKILLYYAYWRDYKDTDLKFPENPSEVELCNFYNLAQGKGNLHLSFALRKMPEITRENIMKSFDRFLIFVLQESSQKKNSQRAFKYAYGKVKEWLLPLSIEERNRFTYGEIIEKIIAQSVQENLSFQICDKNCRNACKHFAKQNGWAPTRKQKQKRMVAPTRQ